MAARVNKERAEILRKSGLDYPQIAEQLGCSIAWCKKNLKGLTKAAPEEAAESLKGTILVDEIRRLGRQLDGVTDYEVRRMIRAAYPKLATKDLTETVSNLKKKARRGSKDVVIRPAWLAPEAPWDNLDTMMVMAQEVYEFMHLQAGKFRQQFNLPDEHQKSIVYELSKLSAGAYNKLMPQGLSEYGRYLESMAETLDERRHPSKKYKGPRKTKVTKVSETETSHYAEGSNPVQIPEPELPY